MTRTVFAMGGGGFTMEPANPLLDEAVLALASVREPRILFLPTAGGDSGHQIAAFHAAFGGRACHATHLSLFRLHGTTRPLRELVFEQDVVYVGGGSMRNLLAIWQAHGLDAILREAYARGVALAGLSAGAMCWFAGGVTMSGGPAQIISGLGLLPGSFSVHADGEPARLPVFVEAVRAGELPGGWAADDGVALHFEDERLVRVVSSRPGATALRVDAVGGELVRNRIQPELLGERSAGRPPDPVIDELRQLRRFRDG